ncbi:TPA: restriction endonuclease subunit S [Enterococcus faecium]
MSNDTQPEIRFPGFTDDWEERKLGDEVRIVMGQSPNSENYTDDPNDYILVQGNADMKNGRVFPRVWTTQVTKQAEKDDLILSVRAPVGDIGKTAYDVVIGRGVAAIKGNEFIFQNLGKMKSDGYWTRYSTGSTFESINSTDIKEAIISVPTIEEQNKIGSFFKQLDNTIALHQRKLDLLKETKKGFLQKMFPKNGAKVPEIRFPGFTDDWEQRKLSELATMNARIGWQNLRTSEFLDKGDYMLITGTDFKDGAIDYSNIHYVERERFEQDKKIQISNGSILITKDGTLGKVAYVEGLTMPATLNAGVFNVRVKENLAIDSRYLFHYLKAPFLLKFADQRSTGGTIKHLNQNVLVEFPIPLPSLEEQHKVAGLLSNFDNTIALHQRKLDLLKETKKGFLQKMFV